jgi:hypothetical protein
MITLTVQISASLDEMTGVSVEMFPNPSSSEVTVELAGANFESAIVTDQFGRTVKVSNNGKFSVATLANGIYQVTILSDKGTAVRRLVVNK